MRSLQESVETLETVAAASLDHAAKARRLLKESLPDAAQWLLTAARVAANRGNSKPAETILRELPLSDDPNDRVLRSQFSAGQAATPDTSSRVQVLIGVNLGGVKTVQPRANAQGQLSAAADSNAQAITVEAVSVKAD